MPGRIVLISDDTNFFDYIRNKLELRKSDELFLFNFDEILSKIKLLETSVLIVNSENNQKKTLELLKIFKNTPIIVVAYNEDENFKKKCYRAGMLDFMVLLTPDSEFRARLLPALNISGLLKKNKQYRKILADYNIISANNEVFISYENILENEINDIISNKRKAIFGAIAPSDKTKLKISQNNIETIILANIRKNDILINYAPNKYFIILYNSDLKSAQKLWQKINNSMPFTIFAGFTVITNKKKQALINEALNKLHEAINFNKTSFVNEDFLINRPLEISSNSNFKIFKQEFNKKIEKIIVPAFYQIQQVYSNKLVGVAIEQEVDKGEGLFKIKNKNYEYLFKISSPGYAKINIDIILQKDKNILDSKRISLNPDELETGLVQDLLEQFVLEYKKGETYDT